MAAACFPFPFNFILVFTSELGKASHFSSVSLSLPTCAENGGKNLGLVFFFSVKLSVFWVFGFQYFSIPRCIVCKVIFGFIFLVLVLYRLPLMRFGVEGWLGGGVFVVFPSVFFLLVGMKDEGCRGKVALG